MQSFPPPVPPVVFTEKNKNIRLIYLPLLTFKCMKHVNKCPENLFSELPQAKIELLSSAEVTKHRVK